MAAAVDLKSQLSQILSLASAKNNLATVMAAAQAVQASQAAQAAQVAQAAQDALNRQHQLQEQKKEQQHQPQPQQQHTEANKVWKQDTSIKQEHYLSIGNYNDSNLDQYINVWNINRLTIWR